MDTIEAIFSAEREILSQQPVCPAFSDTKVLTKLWSDQFYNPEVMKAWACLSGLIIYRADGDDYIIRNWLGVYPTIIGRGSFGVVARSNYLPLFLKSGSEDLVHEAFVGIKCLNNLREYIPNFAYVIGYFKAKQPVIEPPIVGDKILSYALVGTPSDYVIYENIIGDPLYKYIEQSDASGFLDKYYQCVLALYMAFDKYRFNHGDLHAGNVIVRDIKANVSSEKSSETLNTQNITNTTLNTQSTTNATQKPRTIIFDHPTKGKVYYPTTSISTIIDYGMARVELDSKNYAQSKRFIPQAFPMFDVYKLLLSSAHIAIHFENKDVMNVCETIYKFFSGGNLSSAVRDQETKGYELPFEERLMSIGFTEFIGFLDKEFDIKFLETPGDVLRCGECDTVETGIIGDNVFMNAVDGTCPRNSSDLNASNPEEQKSNVGTEQKSNAPPMEIHSKEYDKLFSELKTSKLSPVDLADVLRDLPNKYISNDTLRKYLSQYLRYISTVIYQLDLAGQVKKYALAGMEVSKNCPAVNEYAVQFVDGALMDRWLKENYPDLIQETDKLIANLTRSELIVSGLKLSGEKLRNAEKLVNAVPDDYLGALVGLKKYIGWG